MDFGGLKQMTIYLDVLQVSSHTIIRRTRKLALPGKVLVALGDAVRPMDIVAETTSPAEVITLDVARGLGVSLAEMDTCLLRKPGDMLKEGDLIAQCEGALTRLVRSPVDGVLLDVSRGKAVLATGRQVVSLRAGMIGIVEDVFPEYGVELRVEGSLVQSAWGNGQVGEGTLQVIASESEEEEALALTSGAILVLNSLTDPLWFERILTYELSGLVTGWMSFELLEMAAGCAVPILVLSGFGEGQMDPVTWELLSTKNGETCCLNAKPVDPFLGQRPELILPAEGGKPKEGLGFRVALALGQRVRILTGEVKGQSGKVVRLEEPLTFESGLTFPAVTVDLLGGDQVQVPQQDLVILGK